LNVNTEQRINNSKPAPNSHFSGAGKDVADRRLSGYKLTKYRAKPEENFVTVRASSLHSSTENGVIDKDEIQAAG